MLKPSDVVVDIGGWACPFNRADYVVDACSYDTRGFYRTFGGPPSQGGAVEHFTRDTWIERDICSREPLPFKDKAIDFVICSHVLEDLRDPLWVCGEMIRIARRGYVEVPSRLAESCRGWEHPRTAGLSHHRWFVEISGHQIQFLMKYHFSSLRRYSFPPSFLDRVTPEQKVATLFWEESFDYSERMVHGFDQQRAEQQRFINSVRPRTRVATFSLGASEIALSVTSRAARKLARAWASLASRGLRQPSSRVEEPSADR